LRKTSQEKAERNVGGRRKNFREGGCASGGGLMGKKLIPSFLGGGLWKSAVHKKKCIREGCGWGLVVSRRKRSHAR